MKVGISVGTTFDPADSARAARSVLAQADAAARARLDSLTVADRHSLAPNEYLQNVPLIGRILGVWHQRPVGCLFLVPLWHPVLMAEQSGTLAAIAAAPFIIQAGAGDGQPQFAPSPMADRRQGVTTVTADRHDPARPPRRKTAWG
jgi:alkanesulfonate monooxygenase SsuD/methylene tetrahydromethanopterin reductase-like flavin-dependent oxidoreductase (luciferase family)